MAILMHVFCKPFYTFTVPMLEVARAYDAQTSGDHPRYLYKDFDVEGKFFFVTSFEPGELKRGGLDGFHANFSTCLQSHYFADQIAGKSLPPFGIRTNSGTHTYPFPNEAVSIGVHTSIYLKPGAPKTGFWSFLTGYGRLQKYASVSAVQFGEPIFLLFSGRCSAPGDPSLLYDILIEFAERYTRSAYQSYLDGERQSQRTENEEEKMLEKLRKILAMQDEFKAKEMLRSMDFLKLQDSLTQLSVGEIAKLFAMK